MVNDIEHAALLQGLGDFDRTSLREGAAALLLWPENGDRHAALRLLVEALGPSKAGGKPEIGREQWAAWLAGEGGATLQAIQPDGYNDAPICVEATILGTSQALLAGQLEFPALHYRIWMEALADGDEPHLEAARELLIAVVSLYSRVAEISGIGGHRWLGRKGPRPITAPPEEVFERLRASLRIEFDDPEVARILSPLQRDPETAPWQPLSREGESTLVIANPWQLSLAGLIRGLDLAARSPLWPNVLDRVRRAALVVVADAVREMEWTVESVAEDHLLARADVDCLVVVGVGVLSPDPAQFAAESIDADADLREWSDRVASLARSLGASHSLLAVIGDGHAIVSDDPALRGTAESDPWLVGLGELQAIGEGLRTDPLALPAALQSIPRPPWPENLDLLDLVGMIRQEEEGEAPTEEGNRRLDGTEYMLMRGRIMAARHPAIAPGLAGWVEVTRWEGVEEPAIFCHRERDDFALLIRGPGRYFWVTCPGSLERRHELLPVIATVLAFWLARLFERGLLTPPQGAEPLYAGFQLELDRRPGPQLAMAQKGSDTRIVLGAGFVETLCLGNNDSDRMLVGAILAWGKALVGEEPQQVLDAVAPRGRGTLVIWRDPETTSISPRLEPLPPVEPRFRRGIKRALASMAVGEGEVLVASDEDLAPVLDRLSRDLEDAIQERLYSLEPSALRDLVALHERATRQSSMEAIHLPARSVMRFAPTHPGVSDEILNRDLLLRILVERCSALPPRGSKPFGRRTAAWLRAAGELQLELRGALDTVRWEKAGGRVIVSPETGIHFDLEGELLNANETMKSQMLSAAPDLMADAHEDWWGDERPEIGAPPALDEPIELTGRWIELDRSMAEAWGIGFEQLVRVLYALAAIADEQPDCVGCSAPDQVESELARRTALPAETISAAVTRLTLSPCAEYDAFDEAHQPGRANRERSYMRRPLVALPDGALCWSTLHCQRSAQYLNALIESGRLGSTGALAIEVTKISQELDRAFEDAVLAKARDCDWKGKVRLDRLDGVPLRRRRGEEIGDIDVLAWSPERRRVWLLDAKRLNPGVEPGPMLREGLTFETHTKRHEERLRWVRDHLSELAREIGVETMVGWEIEAALVLDRPLTGAHLGQTSMPIWTLWELPDRLSYKASFGKDASLPLMGSENDREGLEDPPCR